MQVSLGEEHGIKNFITEEETKNLSSADLVIGGVDKIKRMYDIASKKNSEVCKPKK